jgi:imidazoleglycerol phosphate synthase glutamine amidotransferase subunit HisH
VISIIDYGMGNLRSVRNAFAYLGVPSRLIRTPEEVLASERLLVPGVGSFREAMQNLASLQLVEPRHAAPRRGG